MRRSLFLIVVLMAIPAAVAWGALGDPEVADPTFAVSDEILEQLLHALGER